MPALFFNPSPFYRIFQFLFFWFLAWFSGKKPNLPVTFLVILSIVAFNLLVPYGRVLASFGAFRITLGALRSGLQRAFTLEALIMLSRFAIRRDLRFPGAFGELIGESFRIFALIMDRKGVINRQDVAGSIDALMIELSEVPAERAKPGTGGDTHGNSPMPGIIILALIIILSWLPVILHCLGPQITPLLPFFLGLVFSN
jgi:heptaprenyl diphosphate synthase